MTFSVLLDVFQFQRETFAMAKKHYVDSCELEEWWHGWNLTKCPYAWDEMVVRIQKICEGVAIKFNPRKENDEYEEHVHDAFVCTLEKIKTGKLKFTHGRAPVFNLLTTTIFRILYSKCNKIKKQREYHKKYVDELAIRHPEIKELHLAKNHDGVPEY